MHDIEHPYNPNILAPPTFEGEKEGSPTSSALLDTPNMTPTIVWNLLNTPIPDDVTPDARTIVDAAENWRQNSNLSKATFAEKILGKTRRSYYDILTRQKIQKTKKIFVRIYNFMKTSDAQKAEILKIPDIYPNFKEEEFEIGAHRSSRISVDEALEILNTPFPEDVNVDTRNILEGIEKWRKATNLSQRVFALKIFGLSKTGYCSFFRRNSKWENLREEGKLKILKMYNWLRISGQLKAEILKLDLYGTMDPWTDSEEILEDVDLLDSEFYDDHCWDFENEITIETAEDQNDVKIEIGDFETEFLPPPIHSLQDALQILNSPLPDNVTRNVKRIVEDVEIWRKYRFITQETFAKQVLRKKKQVYSRLVSNFNRWNELRNFEKLIVKKMYNWLRIPEEWQTKILNSTEPEPLTSSESIESKFTKEEALEILEHPIADDVILNTEAVVRDVEKWRQNFGISKTFFSKKILNRDVKTYHSYLQFPDRNWQIMAKAGKVTILRMLNWLVMSQEDKMEILKLDLFGSKNTVKGAAPRGTVENPENSEDVDIEKVEDVEMEVELVEEEPEILQNPLIHTISSSEIQEFPIPEAIYEEEVETTEIVTMPFEILNGHDYAFSMFTALEILDSPIPDDVILNTKSILEGVENWRLQTFDLSVGKFARKILGCSGHQGYQRLLRNPPEFENMKVWKLRILRMYNWLQISEELKWKILELVEIPAPSDFEFSSQFKYEDVERILNSSIPDDTVLNTSLILAEVEKWREYFQVSKKTFAEKVLGRRRDSYLHILRDPNPWEKCRKQRRMVYIRMHNWLLTSETQKRNILSFGKRRITDESTSERNSIKRARFEESNEKN